MKQLAESLAEASWKMLPGAREPSRNCAHALQHCESDLLIEIIGEANCMREEWLLIEWPTGESEPTKYWLSTLPADTKLVDVGETSQTSLDH